MRCGKCGRLPKNEAPKWAFPCCCEILVPLKETLLDEADFERAARIDALAERVKAAGHTGIEGLVALAKGENPLVAAIRADKVVGMGTCSRIDECYSDKELAMALAEDHITTVADALRWAREDEGLFLEQGLNQRWGEPGDSQLANYREFQAADKENPVEEDAPSRNDGFGLVWDDE